MKLIWKQLYRDMLKNKVFITLILIAVTFTSFMYYFVHFSVDGNVRLLSSLAVLEEREFLYHKGLMSNTSLARNILIGLTGLTGFVITMFFYRFYKTARKQLGCLKALGFKDVSLWSSFVGITAILSLAGASIGLGAGYFASDILIKAGEQSYQLTELVKELNLRSLCIGFFVPAAVFCLIPYVTYQFIRRKDIALLIAEADNSVGDSAALRAAAKAAGLFPEKSRLSVRLALRKPIAVFLVVLSAASFLVMFIMGYSLTLSSPKVMETQTKGHYYQFDTHFNTPRTAGVITGETLCYLDSSGVVENGKVRIERTIAGLEENSGLFQLMDPDGNAVRLPGAGEIVVGIDLQELYDFQIGDPLTVSIGNQRHDLTISGIAFNAVSNWVYVSKSMLTEMLLLPLDSYTGIWSMEHKYEGQTVTSREQKLDVLKRGSVSNRSSAIINQSIGCLIGCILLYLALLLNFQDSTRDILILHLMGYQKKYIRKMLIDIYKPIVWLSFVLTLYPAILLVKFILKSLSIQIGDYMPFQTNAFVIAGIFLLLNLVYFLVQTTFNLGIQRIIKKELYFEYTN